jgi:hypothetical protein
MVNGAIDRKANALARIKQPLKVTVLRATQPQTGSS